MAGNRIRAAMYLRQSLDKEGRMLAVSRQREDLQELCRRRGWTVIEYVDNDFSASVRMPGSKRASKRRPAYEQMVDDIKSDKVDAIAVWDADRLYRHPRELEDLIDLADTKKLSLATMTGDFDLSTPTGRGGARMKGVFARMEMEQKSIRQKRANKQMALHEGRPWWPSRPFGYDASLDPITGRWWTVRRDPSTKAITAVNAIRLNPAEARLVQEAYRQFNAGATLRSIASAWNTQGVATPKGNAWSTARVRALLLAARNAGLREYEGTVIGEGTWPAIVSRETWEYAAHKLSDPLRNRGTSPSRRYLLSRIARCGRCNAPLRTSVSTRKKRCYACSRCYRVSRSADRLDALIVDIVVRRLSRDDAMDLLMRPADEVDVNALRDERAGLHERLALLGKDFATAPTEFVQAALEVIRARLDEIDGTLVDPGRARAFRDVVGAKDVRKAFEQLDLGRRRAIVDALITITVMPVGKCAGPVFDPTAIQVAWKDDLDR